MVSVRRCTKISPALLRTTIAVAAWRRFCARTRERGACLFHEADWPLMLAALVRHVEAVQARAAA